MNGEARFRRGFGYSLTRDERDGTWTGCAWNGRGDMVWVDLCRSREQAMREVRAIHERFATEALARGAA